MKVKELLELINQPGHLEKNLFVTVKGGRGIEGKPIDILISDKKIVLECMDNSPVI